MSRFYMTHLVRGVPLLDATRLLRRLGLLGGLGIRTFSGNLLHVENKIKDIRLQKLVFQENEVQSC